MANDLLSHTYLHKNTKQWSWESYQVGEHIEVQEDGNPEGL